MNDKKGFLLYFDNMPMVLELPPEQRGLLLTALFRYAEGVWRDESVTMESVLSEVPGLMPQTRLACGFMGANILRDTRRWLSQQQSRTRARLGRQAAPESVPSPETQERVRADLEQMRRAIRNMTEEPS